MLNVQDQILLLLKDAPSLSSLDLVQKFNTTTEALYANINPLVVAQYINIETQKITKQVLTKEAEVYAQKGTPEFQIFSMIPPEGMPKDELEKAFGDSFKFGWNECMKKKLVVLKEGKVYRQIQKYQDVDQKKLIDVLKGAELTKELVKELKARKFLEEKTTNNYIITKGPKYREKRVVFEPQLTSAMLQSGQWQTKEFLQFNLNALGAQVQNGNLHHLMKVASEFKQILIQLGFQQMKTNRYVESSFWNFDALFQPQFHPARDAHDTFFINDPSTSKFLDQDFKNRVKQVHKQGGFGSIGYGSDWTEEEASKNILRTHTTAISSRTLHKLASLKDYKPRKFFSIDRVFRNETLDLTHLAEFHQIQGFVIDRNLGLNHLIGIIRQFYKKIGIKKIWLKPTYNPYTQPSMEIYGYHPDLKKKVEIGNSGIFRPEMLRPMGFPQDINVIAWGLGLQRPTMIQYNIPNIKELFGPSVNLRKLRDNAICCISYD